MIFLSVFRAFPCDFIGGNIIKASAGKRRLGVRVVPGGFTPPGGRGESLSRIKWVVAGGVE